MPSPVLTVFAREPIPGRCKRRLIPVLGADAAAALADAFIRDALAKASRVAGRNLLIAGASPGNATRSPYFRALARRYRVRVIDQGWGDLGARMARVIRPYASRGVLLVGTDTPTLPLAMLAQSVRLIQGGASVVVAPALDGGYYALGVRGDMPPIFNKMRWGRSDVLDATLARLRARDIPYALGPWWYDVDRPSDLAFLRAHMSGNLPRSAHSSLPVGNPHPCLATRAILRNLGSLL